MAKTACKVLGVILLLVGLIGFANPGFLGMHLSVFHNIIHLVTGALALYFGFAGTLGGARTFCVVFGAVYLLLALLGFIAPGLTASLLQAQHLVGPTESLIPDNIVHLILGGVFLAAGLVREPRPAATV